jgi:hypothetical protein
MALFGRGWLRERPGSPSARSGVAGWRPARSSALSSSTTPAATSLAAAAARSAVARDSVGVSVSAPERAP